MILTMLPSQCNITRQVEFFARTCQEWPCRKVLTNTDSFLRRERAVEIAGDHVPFLSASDTLLLSCMSVAKAFFNREPMSAMSGPAPAG